MGRAGRRAVGLGLLALSCLQAASVYAQATPTEGDRLAKLEAELAAQRELIEAQQAAIAKLEGSAPASEEDSEAALMAELRGGGGEGHGDEAAIARQDPLSLYGFLDVGLQRMFIPEELLIGGVVPTRESTFVLGNLNLYLDARPTDDWRALSEIRFTNLPHGAETSFRIPGASEYERTDRFTVNVTSPDGRDDVLLGSIIIERAWVEWHGEPLLRVRAGTWLTPFGIWNVDHGTPVLISLLQPDFQIQRRFPPKQTGLQFSGEASSGDWTLGYHATISNGRPTGLLDPTDDKAVGGRVHATHFGEMTTKIGMSGYWGPVHDFIKELRGGSFARMTTVDGSEWVLGADLSIDIDRLRVRTEAVISRIDFEDGKHAPADFAAPGATVPNHYYEDAYVTVAYQLPVWNLEPLWYTEIAHRPATLGDTSFILGPGLNVNFSAAVQLKSMVAVIILTDLVGEDTSPDGENKFVIATSRLVLAF